MIAQPHVRSSKMRTFEALIVEVNDGYLDGHDDERVERVHDSLHLTSVNHAKANVLYLVRAACNHTVSALRDPNTRAALVEHTLHNRAATEVMIAALPLLDAAEDNNSSLEYLYRRKGESTSTEGQRRRHENYRSDKRENDENGRAPRYGVLRVLAAHGDRVGAAGRVPNLRIVSAIRQVLIVDCSPFGKKKKVNTVYFNKKVEYIDYRKVFSIAHSQFSFTVLRSILFLLSSLKVDKKKTAAGGF